MGVGIADHAALQVCLVDESIQVSDGLTGLFFETKPFVQAHGTVVTSSIQIYQDVLLIGLGKDTLY